MLFCHLYLPQIKMITYMLPPTSPTPLSSSSLPSSHRQAASDFLPLVIFGLCSHFIKLSDLLQCMFFSLPPSTRSTHFRFTPVAAYISSSSLHTPWRPTVRRGDRGLLVHLHIDGLLGCAQSLEVTDSHTHTTNIRVQGFERTPAFISVERND